MAVEHYLQATDEHFERAASGALQNPVQSPTASSRTEAQGEPTTALAALRTRIRATMHSCPTEVKRGYWAQQDSNLRPTDYESAALTN